MEAIDRKAVQQSPSPAAHPPSESARERLGVAEGLWAKGAGGLQVSGPGRRPSTRHPLPSPQVWDLILCIGPGDMAECPLESLEAPRKQAPAGKP